VTGSEFLNKYNGYTDKKLCVMYASDAFYWAGPSGHSLLFRIQFPDAKILSMATGCTWGCWLFGWTFGANFCSLFLVIHGTRM